MVVMSVAMLSVFIHYGLKSLHAGDEKIHHNIE